MALKDYTAADLASLAPEERAALETAEGDPDGILNELAAGGEEEGAAAAPPAPAAAPAAEGGAAPAASPTAAPAGAAPATEAGAPAAAPAASAPASEPSPAPAPTTVVYRADNVGDVAKDVQTQKDTIKAERAKESEALRKLNDGDIDFDEYQTVKTAADAAIDAANDKILELNRAQARAEVAVELTTQQQAGAWKGMLDTYVATAKTAGMDLATNEALRTEFNGLLKAFAIEATERGLTDDANMTASRWALDQAGQIMGFRHAKAAAAPVASAAAPAGTPATAPAPAPNAAAALGGLTTLAKMPAAAAAPIADDVMSKIGTLEGEELELYMASLPKDVYSRVTAGAQ